MQLNEKDLARMPQDFSAQLKMAVPGTNITVSNTPCNIPDGFLLVYGGIDVNCTFASLFEAAGDTLQDPCGRHALSLSRRQKRWFNEWNRNTSMLWRALKRGSFRF